MEQQAVTPTSASSTSSASSASSASPRRSHVARKPKRKSDPVRPGKSPAPRQHDSWEFPLSREEKKYRVMCLFEQELAQAQQTGEDMEALIDENQALHAELERLGERRHSVASRCEEKEDEEVAALPSSPPDSRADAAACRAHVAEEVTKQLESSSASQGLRCPVPAIALGVAAALLLVAFLWLPTSGDSLASPEVTLTGPLPVPDASPAAAPSLNATAAALRLRAHGLQRLKHSDCWKAEWYFSSALKLLEEQVALESLESVSLNGHRSSLLGDRSFALICAQRFGQGAALLEPHLRGGSFEQSPSYLLNALGYARFQQQDYSRALDAFASGTRRDPQNPILWNNLGATQMVLGDFQEADDAMVQAAEYSDPKKKLKEGSVQVQEYHQQMFLNNVQELMNRAIHGQASMMPVVELWWGGEGELLEASAATEL